MAHEARANLDLTCLHAFFVVFLSSTKPFKTLLSPNLQRNCTLTQKPHKVLANSECAVMEERYLATSESD